MGMIYIRSVVGKKSERVAWWWEDVRGYGQTAHEFASHCDPIFAHITTIVCNGQISITVFARENKATSSELDDCIGTEDGTESI
eukprot:scaffold14763_cov137-Amphora_coffeaeformis.AAC.5